MNDKVMTTTEPTVEECLKELREIVSDRPLMVTRQRSAKQMAQVRKVARRTGEGVERVRCHLKLKKISSFKAVTRKQPFLCKSGNPATGTHIFIFEGEPETVEQIVERLRRIDPSLTLCSDCAAAVPETFAGQAKKES